MAVLAIMGIPAGAADNAISPKNVAMTARLETSTPDWAGWAMAIGHLHLPTRVCIVSIETGFSRRRQLKRNFLKSAACVTPMPPRRAMVPRGFGSARLVCGCRRPSRFMSKSSTSTLLSLPGDLPMTVKTASFFNALTRTDRPRRESLRKSSPAPTRPEGGARAPELVLASASPRRLHAAVPGRRRARRAAPVHHRRVGAPGRDAARLSRASPAPRRRRRATRSPTTRTSRGLRARRRHRRRRRPAHPRQAAEHRGGGATASSCFRGARIAY